MENTQKWLTMSWQLLINWKQKKKAELRGK
jgi:hypothetical protein